MRDGDFDKQLHERLALAEREKRDAIALAEANVTHALQSAAARKDAEIQALQAQLAAAEVRLQAGGDGGVGRGQQSAHAASAEPQGLYPQGFSAQRFIEVVEAQAVWDNV